MPASWLHVSTYMYFVSLSHIHTSGLMVLVLTTTTCNKNSNDSTNATTTTSVTVATTTNDIGDAAIGNEEAGTDRSLTCLCVLLALDAV